MSILNKKIIGNLGKIPRKFKTEADLSAMTELEVTKYSNELRIIRNRLKKSNTREKEIIQKAIDLTEDRKSVV